MKKLSNTEAELKKSVAYKKQSVHLGAVESMASEFVDLKNQFLFQYPIYMVTSKSI